METKQIKASRTAAHGVEAEILGFDPGQDEEIVVISMPASVAAALKTVVGAVTGLESGSRGDTSAVWRALNYLGVQSLPNDRYTGLIHFIDRPTTT